MGDYGCWRVWGGGRLDLDPPDPPGSLLQDLAVRVEMLEYQSDLLIVRRWLAKVPVVIWSVTLAALARVVGCFFFVGVPASISKSRSKTQNHFIPRLMWQLPQPQGSVVDWAVFSWFGRWFCLYLEETGECVCVCGRVGGGGAAGLGATAKKASFSYCESENKHSCSAGWFHDFIFPRWHHMIDSLWEV